MLNGTDKNVWFSENIKKLAKTVRFSFFFTQEVETQEHGKWTVILTILDKPKPKGY